MHGRLILSAICIAVVFAVHVEPAGADDAGKPEYSVLYHGNYDDADAHRFSARLHDFGGIATWTGATQWSYAGKERDVNHWDYTNGNPGIDPYLPANRADLLYASGHGGTNGMTIFSPTRPFVAGERADETREKDANGLPDNIGPDVEQRIEGTGEEINWEIGSDFIGTNRTASRWDDDIEWVFLAACDQLASTNFKGGASYSRRNYARTLLGDPHRAHAVWSYRGLAPNDGVDVQIVDEFFTYNAAKKSNRYSWLKANLNHGALGAGVVHASDQYEGLPPVNRPDPDSPTGSTPDVRYWYHDGSERNVTQPVDHRAMPVERLRSALMDLVTTEVAHAASPEFVVGTNTTFRLRVELPPLKNLPAVQVGNSRRAVDEEETARLLGGKPERRQLQLNPDIVTRFGPKGMIVDWKSGAQRIVLSRESRVPVGAGEQAAIASARRFATELGAIPSDAEVRRVNKIASAPIDLNDGSLGEEAVSEYVVDFGHSYEGTEIDGVAGDKVSVVVDADGVAEMHRSWRSVEGKESGLRARLTALDALQVLADSSEQMMDMPEEVDVTAMGLVYYSAGPSESQGVMFPAWRITLRDSEHFYVNAVTGRPMNE